MIPHWCLCGCNTVGGLCGLCLVSCVLFVRVYADKRVYEDTGISISTWSCTNGMHFFSFPHLCVLAVASINNSSKAQVWPSVQSTWLLGRHSIFLRVQLCCTWWCSGNQSCPAVSTAHLLICCFMKHLSLLLRLCFHDCLDIKQNYNHTWPWVLGSTSIPPLWNCPDVSVPWSLRPIPLRVDFPAWCKMWWYMIGAIWASWLLDENNWSWVSHRTSLNSGFRNQMGKSWEPLILHKKCL